MTVQARRGCRQTRMAGAYTDQRLNLSKLWEGRRKKCQGFKPDPGNAAVRDYRGGVGKRQPWWECAPVLQSKERETETPHLQRGAPDFYPNHEHLRLKIDQHQRRIVA